MDRCQSCFREYDGTVCPYCGGAQNEEHQLPIGTMIRERYKIGRVLGQGGFGITYAAWDTLLDKCVAVKEFYPSGTVFRRSELSTAVECGTKAMVPHYEYSRERFLREASALAKFQDIPEVVGLLDFVKANNTAYIVMEFVRGLDLKKYIAMKGGKLSVKETFRILKPVMEALAKVHKAGIVHRDISPDNIILDPMGGAKLLDFGAVRTVGDPEVDKELTQSTEAIIKHGFAPLEQYNTRGSLGPWTDEYAMCATVWYCLTGTVPEEVTIRMAEGTDPDWSSIEGLPEHQQKALAKGFSCRAKDRYKNMDQLLEALFPGEVPEAPAEEEKPEEKKPEPPRAEKEEPASAEKKTKAPTGSEEKKPAKKRTWILAAAAVLILLIVAVALIPKAPKTAPEEPQLQEQPETTAEATQPTTEPLSEEERQYLLAEQLLAEGKFQEAIDIFTALGDYKDSKDRIPECHYLWAEAMLAEGKFQAAIDKFAELGDYSDSAVRINDCHYSWAGQLETEGKLGEAAIKFGKLAGFSDARERSFAIWDKIAIRNTVSTGENHTLGLKVDGTLLAIGMNSNGECDVKNWTDIIALSAGRFHTVGLRSDGTVVAVGSNADGRCDVENWTDIVAISANRYHTVGLKVDGTVVAVGYNQDGRCNVEEWTDIVAIGTGAYHTVGLRADGTVVAVGGNLNGRCDVEDWTDVVAIFVGGSITTGLKADGTVVAVGHNGYGQCNVGDWTDIVAIWPGVAHTVGLKSDGTVVAVGYSTDGRSSVDGWTDIVAITAGHAHTIGLKSDGTVVAVGTNQYGHCNVSDWTDIRIPQERVPFR